jgi:hypothetical protein
LLSSGEELYLWQRNLFVSVPAEQTRVWVRVREVDVGLDPLPHCGRIDVHICAPSLKEEAHWLRLITKEIDWVRREGVGRRPLVYLFLHPYAAAPGGVPWTLGLITTTESRDICPLQSQAGDL